MEAGGNRGVGSGVFFLIILRRMILCRLVKGRRPPAYFEMRFY
jgi:hypothetical protein